MFVFVNTERSRRESLLCLIVYFLNHSSIHLWTCLFMHRANKQYKCKDNKCVVSTIQDLQSEMTWITITNGVLEDIKDEVVWGLSMICSQLYCLLLWLASLLFLIFIAFIWLTLITVLWSFAKAIEFYIFWDEMINHSLAVLRNCVLNSGPGNTV